jgi:hypothetical protein
VVLEELLGDFRQSYDVMTRRARLLERCGRIDQAVAEIRAHPEAGTWYAHDDLARFLVDAGRPDEAIAVLETSDETRSASAFLLAELLVRQGRPDEALTVLSDHAASR